MGKFDNPQRYRDIIRSREKWILCSRVYCVVLGRSCLLMLYIFYWFGWSNLFHCISRVMVLLLHDICDFTIVTSQRYIALQQYTLGVSYKPVSKPGNNTLRTCTYSLQLLPYFLRDQPLLHCNQSVSMHVTSPLLLNSSCPSLALSDWWNKR